MISLLVAAAVYAAAFQSAAADASRKAFTACLRQAVDKGKSEKVATAGFDAYMRAPVRPGEHQVPRCDGSFDVKNKVPRKQATSDADRRSATIIPRPANAISCHDARRRPAPSRSSGSGRDLGRDAVEHQAPGAASAAMWRRCATNGRCARADRPPTNRRSLAGRSAAARPRRRSPRSRSPITSASSAASRRGERLLLGDAVAVAGQRRRANSRAFGGAGCAGRSGGRARRGRRRHSRRSASRRGCAGSPAPGRAWLVIS